MARCCGGSQAVGGESPALNQGQVAAGYPQMVYYGGGISGYVATGTGQDLSGAEEIADMIVEATEGGLPLDEAIRRARDNAVDAGLTLEVVDRGIEIAESRLSIEEG